MLAPCSPTPSLLAITILFSASMNLTPPGTSYKWNHTVFVFFCDWLIALRMMSPGTIHVVARVRRSFLLQKPNSIPLNVYTTFRLSTRSSVDTWVASAVRKSSHFPSAAFFSPLRASVPSSVTQKRQTTIIGSTSQDGRKD